MTGTDVGDQGQGNEAGCAEPPDKNGIPRRLAGTFHRLKLAPSEAPACSGAEAQLRRQRIRIEDRVRVALLGEEPLAVLSEVLVDGVPRDEGVEVGGQARLLRAQ